MFQVMNKVQSFKSTLCQVIIESMEGANQIDRFICQYR